MKKSVSLLVVLFSVILNVPAQYLEISLEQKMQNAEFVFEGEVMESESFTTTDNSIYTAHKLKVYKSFKENPINEQHVWVVTEGGDFNGISQYWTHSLYLIKGQAGIFFLNKSMLKPEHEIDANKEFHSVYSGEQGFLQ